MLLDQGRDPCGNEPVERLPGRRERADVARGGRIRLQVEEDDALGLLELPQHGLEPFAGKAGPGRNGEACQLEDGIGLLPGEEVAELVGADHEERVVELARPEQVDRSRVWIEPHVVVGERRPRKLEADLGGREHALVPRRLRDEHDEPGRPKCAFAARATATWPLCGGSNAPP